MTETEQQSTNTHRSVKLEFLSEEPQLRFASPTVNSTEVSWLGELERMTQLYLAAESHGMPLSGKQKSTIGNKLIYSFKKGGIFSYPFIPLWSLGLVTLATNWVPSDAQGYLFRLGQGRNHLERTVRRTMRCPRLKDNQSFRCRLTPTQAWQCAVPQTA